MLEDTNSLGAAHVKESAIKKAACSQSTFRNFHGGDSVRNKIFGHFLYDLERGENP